MTISMFLITALLLLSCVANSYAFDFCRLCGDGSYDAFLPDKIVQIPSYNFINTCGMLNTTSAYILQGSPDCDQLQSLGTFCGCQVQENPCQICSDGGVMDQNLDLANTDISFVDVAGVAPTCEMFVAFAANLDANDPACHDLQRFGSACGCSPVENYCQLCPGEKVPHEKLDQTLGILDFYLGETESSITEGLSVSYTCEFLETSLLQVDRGSYDGCFVPQMFNYLCGCNNGFRVIMGANTKAKRTAILAIPRISASLSLLGSMAILYHVLLKVMRRHRVETGGARHLHETFYYIMLTLASCDLFNSVAWIIGPSATPSMMNGDDSGVPGAIGNMATCKAQAWLLHFGIGCCFYTVSLAIYYKLRIVNGWKEEKFRKIRKYLIGLPFLAALSLAMAGIPLTTAYPYGCTVSVYPLDKYPVEVFCFIILPVGLSTSIIVYMMLQIYLKARRVSRLPAVVGTLQSSRNVNLERKTFWIAALYVAAFMIPWPTSNGLMMFALANGDAPYGVYLVSLALAPLQGLSNAIIYFSNHLNFFCCGQQKAESGDEEEIVVECSNHKLPRRGVSEDPPPSSTIRSKIAAVIIDALVIVPAVNFDGGTVTVADDGAASAGRLVEDGNHNDTDL